MGSREDLLKHFLTVDLLLFTKPLPVEEEEYNCCFAQSWTNWLAILKDKSAHRMSAVKLETINDLMQTAYNFMIKLKSTRIGYMASKRSLAKEWEAVMNLGHQCHFCRNKRCFDSSSSRKCNVDASTS